VAGPTELTMALLLQCLRDVRLQTGDLDLLPPAPGRVSPDDAGGAPHPLGGNGAAARLLARCPAPVAARSRAESADACH